MIKYPIMLEYFGQNTFEVLILLDNIQIKNKNEQDDNNDNNEDVSAESQLRRLMILKRVLLPFLKDSHLFTA